MLCTHLIVQCDSSVCNSYTFNQKQKDITNPISQQAKTKKRLFHVGDNFSCDYHPKTKIQKISCIPLIKDKQITMPLKPYLSQQPSNKGHKCVTILERKEITAYESNLKTAQQEPQH
jgi:hypothetical protein